MTQIVDIIRFMYHHGSITNKIAMGIGIGRLSARINELRTMGIGIDTVPYFVTKRNGKVSRCGMYVFHSAESKAFAYERFLKTA